MRASQLGAPLGQSLLGRTVCIVGLGHVGSALARRLQPFGVVLSGVGRRLDSSHVAHLSLTHYYQVNALHAALAAADVVVLCLPVTAETRGLLDAAALRAMKPRAYLVNVARGALVDYTALRRPSPAATWRARDWTCSGRSRSRRTTRYSPTTSSPHHTSGA